MQSFPSESKKCDTGPNKCDQDRHDHDYQLCVLKFFSVIYHSLRDSPSVTNVLSWFLTDDFFLNWSCRMNNCFKQWFDSQAYIHKVYDANWLDTTEE